MHSTCIDRRNTSHTDDNNLGVVMAVDIYNLVGSSKEHWTTDFKYADGVWNITEFFCLTRSDVRGVGVFPCFDIGGFRHTFHK